MAEISTLTLDSGLPVHRIAIPGTRALTVLVAFDAGARTDDDLDRHDLRDRLGHRLQG